MVKRRNVPKVLKVRPNAKSGYLTVIFYVSGKFINRYVHHLVLEAFGKRRPTGMEGRHLNGNFLDNHVKNLKWGTHWQNFRDQVRHGHLTIGENNGGAKLQNWQIRLIRASKATSTSLANEYNVSLATISRIRHYLRYKNAS